jgi:hypothetical protein
MAVEIQIKPMGAKKMDGMNGGQEQEKATIAQLKDMAMQMAQMCDSLMSREQEEDKTEKPEGQTDESNLMNKLKERFAE